MTLRKVYHKSNKPDKTASVFYDLAGASAGASVDRKHANSPVLAVGQPSLGSIAEFSSQPLKTDLIREKRQAAQEAEQLRWNRIFGRLDTARELLPDERIRHCQRTIAPERNHAIVRCSAESERRAGYSNLVVCESASCPFCGFWRGEKARRELSAALAMAQQDDLFPILMTFTVRHTKHDSLDGLVRAINSAFNRVFSGRWWADFQARWGFIGKIRVIEPTYGRNGWHPHYHLLIFLDIELVGKHLEAFRLEIAQKWAESLQKQGFSASLEHGVDAKVADSEIAEYVAKYGKEPKRRTWGADSEMAKAPVKSASLDGMTPLELLDAAGGNKEQIERLAGLIGVDDRLAVRRRAGELFREYFYVFKGRSRIHWGKGLRERLEVDEQLAIMQEAEEQKKSFDMAFIDRDSWRQVVSLNHDLRAELLAVASQGDVYALWAWLLAKGINAIIPDEAFLISSTLCREREKT